MAVAKQASSPCRERWADPSEFLASNAPATEKENLQEERALLDALDLPECYFWAIHPLDSVKVEGVLGRSKQQMPDALDRSIDNVDEDAISRVSRVGTL